MVGEDNSWTSMRLSTKSPPSYNNADDARILAQNLSHLPSVTAALYHTALLQSLRREGHAVQARTEAVIALAHEHGFSLDLALGTIFHGWALADQRQEEAGIAQLQQGLAAWRATGAKAYGPYFLTLLAEAYGQSGQVDNRLATVTEALDLVKTTGERWYEAEVYRIKGELLLAQEGLRPQAEGLREKIEEAEGCFLRALAIAQKQQAKSLELRAVMSLLRLRQQQAVQPESRITNPVSRAKLAEARRMLSEVYNWFTEGFDTKDLQEAKSLLEELS
jgi:predicted ATPase